MDKSTTNTEASSYEEEVKDAIVMRGDELVDSEKSKQIHIGDIKDHLGELASAKNGDFVVKIEFNAPCDKETKKMRKMGDQNR